MSTNTLGKYQIVREIARSNDVVYEATDPGLGRRVALKELYLPPNLTGAQKRERIERFLREGKAAGQLAHPNIVTIYDVGQEGDRFYIAMEFLEGQTLRDVLQMRGALPVKEAVDITLQLCSALAYAHQHNVVHRDVKPENVQILPGGHVKLTDFGIARIMSEPSITADGQVFGTPSYMSPEQVSGKQIDGRSDIFSVGVMLYEMLAGHKPFAGDTVVTITYNIMNLEPQPLTGVPPYLTQIIHKAMSKDANMRYATVDQLMDDLRNEKPNGSIYYGDPFSSPPPSGYQPTYGGPAPQPYGPPPNPYGPPDPLGSAPGYGQTPQPWSPPGQSVPDPFSQAPMQTPPPMAPPLPREPLLSAETRAFLGILFLVIALTGMLVFAIWAVGEAYSSYIERIAIETANRYAAQGDKLFAQGETAKALEQYSNAMRAAGTTKSGADVRRRISVVYSELARKALVENDYRSVAEEGARAVEADPNASAARYYYGAGSYFMSDLPRAEEQLKKAVDIGGNDQFAIAARKLLAKLYIDQGDAYARAGRRDDAASRYNAAIELQDPDWSDVAQQHLMNMGQ